MTEVRKPTLQSHACHRRGLGREAEQFSSLRQSHHLQIGERRITAVALERCKDGPHADSRGISKTFDGNRKLPMRVDIFLDKPDMADRTLAGIPMQNLTERIWHGLEKRD